MIKRIYSTSAINPSRFFAVLLIVSGCIFLFASCAPTKSAYYFKTIQKDTTLSGLVSKDLESKISKGDNLKIIISSLSREEDAIYNVSPVTGTATREAGFTVEQDGNIMVHKLGIVKAAGLTRKELAEELKKSPCPVF
jgi:polysaccharide export outer membrane protein